MTDVKATVVVLLRESGTDTNSVKENEQPSKAMKGLLSFNVMERNKNWFPVELQKEKLETYCSNVMSMERGLTQSNHTIKS